MINHCVRTKLAAAALFVVAVSATVYAGPIWDCRDPQEPGGTPDEAKTVRGSGPLALMRCQLLGIDSSMAGLVGDFEDMFLIFIAEPTNFQAMTVFPEEGKPFNTQLWLFDFSGRGVVANTDAGMPPGEPPFSLLGPEATDGSGSAVVEPGLYFLAISGGDGVGQGRHPIDGDGNPIFIFIPGPDQFTQIYGPASDKPIAGWAGSGAIGNYEIELLGVEFVEAVPTLSQWAAIIFALLLLTAGTLVIRQQQRRDRAAVAAA